MVSSSSSVVDENSKFLLESFSAIPLVQLPIKIAESQPVAKASASTSKKLGKRCHDEITTPTMKSLKDFFKSPLSNSKRDNGNVARCLDLTPTQQPKKLKLTTPILENSTTTSVILIDESDSKENVAICCGGNKDTPSSDERVEIVPNSEERMEIGDNKDCKDEGKELQKIDWSKCLAVSQQLTVPVDYHL